MRPRKRRGLTLAEIASELVVQLHMSLEQLAGSSEAQVRWVYFRKRGRHGQLLRDSRRLLEELKAKAAAPTTNGQAFEVSASAYLPPKLAIKAAGGPVGHKEMFFSLRRSQSIALLGKVLDGPGIPERLKGKPFTGLTEKDIEEHWQQYLEENPGLRSRLRD